MTTVSPFGAGREKASKFKGVYKCGKKWKAQVQIAGVQHYLGVFEKEEDAAKVYENFLEHHQLLDLNLDERFHTTEAGILVALSNNSHGHANGNISAANHITGEGTVYWPNSLVASHSLNSLYLNDIPSSSEPDYGQKGVFDMNNHNWKDASDHSNTVFESFSSITPTSLPAASFDPLFSKSYLGFHSVSSNHFPERSMTPYEWEREWIRRILVGRLLYLSSCLYEQQFQNYMESLENQQEGKAAPGKNHAYRRLKRKLDQRIADGVLASSDVDGNMLHGYLENCLSRLIDFPS